MTTLAIFEPHTLIGKEVCEGLGRRPDPARQIRGLSVDQERAGALIELGGDAALVQAYEGADSLADVALAFLCGDTTASQPVLDQMPAGLQAILVGQPEYAEGDSVLVAGVNLEDKPRGPIHRSPHPGAIALSLLLKPLQELGLASAHAVVHLPASAADQQGIDEVLEQSRSILAFTSRPEPEVFGTQLAYNLLPGSVAGGNLAQQARATLGADVPLAVQTVQAGVFHSVAISLHVVLDAHPEEDEIGELLEASPWIRPVDEPYLLGPIDAAADEHILLGPIARSSDVAAAYDLWAVMDNLTRGGSLNALEIGAALLGKL